jgi:exopolyphosphatase/guanosine-5'-triphosphate,3'-diphosphate pyrophosphatase
LSTLAAIDVGSNSCRLKIARVVAHKLKVLHEDREVTRLGTSVFDSGLVSPEAMAATLRALKRFQRAVQSHGVDQIRVVATSAMRDARNAPAFQAWVKAETGWNMEIISGLEEGRLIHQGLMAGEAGVGGRVVLVDIGGGSCEITFSEHKHIKETISLPLGAVRLTEEFLQADPPPADGLARLRQFVAREMRRAQRKIKPPRGTPVVATSGTAATLFEALGAARKSARSSKRPSGSAPRTVPLIATREVRKFASKIAKMTLPEREAVAGIGPRRAEIIVAGAQVFAEVLETFGLSGFRYSPLGLRDGVLAQMLAELDARAWIHREFEHQRWESVLATARRRAAAVPRAQGSARAPRRVRGLACRRRRPAGYGQVHQPPESPPAYTVCDFELGVLRVQPPAAHRRFGHRPLPGQEPATAQRSSHAQHSRRGTQARASRSSAAAPGRGPQSGPRQRRAARLGPCISQARLFGH